MEETNPIAPRDYAGEVTALYEARPELQGEALPQQVIEACVGGKSLTEAYNDYAGKLRQEQDTAAHAPVRSVTLGGSTAQEPQDAFLSGFNAQW